MPLASPENHLPILQFIAKVTRVKEWHDSKMPLFFVTCYSFLFISGEPYVEQFTKSARFLVFCASYLAFNYSFNDYCDRSCDRLAGKKNAITECTPLTTLLVLGIPMTLAIAVSLPGVQSTATIVIYLACWFCGIAYSAPPFRFKERGIFGVIVSAVSQRVLPLTVGMVIFGIYPRELYALCLLSTLIGLRWILIHQLLDYDNDVVAKVHTFVRSVGKTHAITLLKYIVFPGELASLFWWLYLMTERSIWFLLLIPFYLTWLMLQVHAWKGRGSVYTWDRYNRPQLGDLYTAILPLGTGVMLCLQNKGFIPLILLQLILFRPYLKGQLDAVFKQMGKTA